MIELESPRSGIGEFLKILEPFVAIGKLFASSVIVTDAVVIALAVDCGLLQLNLDQAGRALFDPIKTRYKAHVRSPLGYL